MTFPFDPRAISVAPDAPGASAAAADPSPARTHRGPDRRKRPTPRFSRYTFWGGRRRGARRVGEGEGAFVDQYGASTCALMVWVALMNVGDSFFTLLHLQTGGIELNPFAAFLLRSGRLGFVGWKSLLITVPLCVLCLHKNFPLARLGIFAAASAYTLLFGYHVWLL